MGKLEIFHENQTSICLKPHQNFPRPCFLWRLFVICVCLCHTVMSISCSPVVTCWERAGLFVLLCVMFSCVLSLSKTGVLGQVCYLIVLNIDLCFRPNFIQKYHIL